MKKQPQKWPRGDDKSGKKRDGQPASPAQVPGALKKNAIASGTSAEKEKAEAKASARSNRPPDEDELVAIPPDPNPLLVIISAPSGGGKTTLCHALLAANPNMTRAVTCTTRAPRKGEREGIDYFFLDHETFLKRVQAGHFLEHATVHGNSYGTLRSEVLRKLRSGKDVLLSVDVQGAASICERAREESDLEDALVTLFLTTATIKELEQRLKKRATDAPEIIQKRLGVARQEIAQWRNFHYLVISTSIEEDLRRALAIVQAEKMRVVRAQPPKFD